MEHQLDFLLLEKVPTEGTTQGDPLAKGMYAVAITPLIHCVLAPSIGTRCTSDLVCR